MKDQLNYGRERIKACLIPALLLILLCNNTTAYANDFIEITAIADAPWRINSGDWIPINLMIKEAEGPKAYDLEAIYVYDNNQGKSVTIYNENGNPVGNNLGGELPKKIDQYL